MRFGLLRFAEADMFNTVVGILLVLIVGMCVVAFPFVLWMLFGDGPRSRHTRHTSRPRGNGAPGSSAGEKIAKKPRRDMDVTRKQLTNQNTVAWPAASSSRRSARLNLRHAAAGAARGTTRGTPPSSRA